MTSNVQRLGDVNDVGAPIESVVGQGFVFCNSRLVSVVGDNVQSHGTHGPVRTAQGSSFMFINGKRVIRAGDRDDCGHTRVGGSPNVFSD